jgi:hypothetical protein
MDATGASITGGSTGGSPDGSAPDGEVVAGHREHGRFRRWYSTLHPSLQLIGLQLWLPLFFIVGFCLCYIAAFHAPHPHDVPVAVVGSSAELRTALDERLPGVVDLRACDDAADARAAVTSGRVAVAYDPEEARLYTASAHQYQVAALIPAMLTPVIEAAGAPAPVVDDLAPLPPYDEYGTVSLYLMLAWCIGGYMVAMFIGLMGAPLRHRTRTTVIVVGGAVISLITNTLAGPVVGAVQGHFVELALLGWGWIIAIGLAVNGISYFVGRFVALPAMIVFVFLSMPASGGAYPAWFMPQPFAWLNNVVVGSGITEMLKRALYDVGPGYGRGLTMMLVYAVVGVVLMITGKTWWERRRVRRIVAGRTTMFIDAQNANRDFLAAERDDVLRRHGLSSTDTGTIRTVAVDERGELDDGTSGDPLLGSPGGMEDAGLDTRPIPTRPRG